MATNKEHTAIQKRMYHAFLLAKKDPKQLDLFINQIKTEMDQEDVAYVEKQVREQYGD